MYLRWFVNTIFGVIVRLCEHASTSDHLPVVHNIITDSLWDCFDHLLVHADVNTSESVGAAAHRGLLSCRNAA